MDKAQMRADSMAKGRGAIHGEVGYTKVLRGDHDLGLTILFLTNTYRFVVTKQGPLGEQSQGPCSD